MNVNIDLAVMQTAQFVGAVVAIALYGKEFNGDKLCATFPHPANYIEYAGDIGGLSSFCLATAKRAIEVLEGSQCQPSKKP